MGSGGECAKQLEQHVQSPGSLLQLHNYVLVVSSPDRAHPWSLASLAALGTGANLEQVRRNSSPLSTTAALVGNLFISMKTVNAGALLLHRGSGCSSLDWGGPQGGFCSSPPGRWAVALPLVLATPHAPLPPRAATSCCWLGPRISGL